MKKSALINLQNKILAQFKNQNESVWVKAKSVSLGVFIGVLPIWGLQSFSSLLLAHLLKLNKVLVLAGSYINFTPALPLIILGSLKTGAYIMNLSLHLPPLKEITLVIAKKYLIVYAAGCIPFGVLTALTFAGITYICIQLISVFKKQFKPAS